MEFKKDFFDGLGETLSRTAKDLSDKASSVYESQKIRSHISSEERQIVRLKTDIGNLIYSRYDNGEQFEGELNRLCEEISERLLKIDSLEGENAGLRGKKICPSCKKEVPVDALFCPACGTACPLPEPEDSGSFTPDPFVQEAGEPMEEAKEAVEEAKEALEETEEAVKKTASEAKEVLEDLAEEGNEAPSL